MSIDRMIVRPHRTYYHVTSYFPAFIPTAACGLHNSLILRCRFLPFVKCTKQIFRFRLAGGTIAPDPCAARTIAPLAPSIAWLPLVGRHCAWLWCLPQLGCWQSSSIRVVRFGRPSYDMVSIRKTIWCCTDIWWKSCAGFLREIERGKVVFALSIRPKWDYRLRLGIFRVSKHA